MNIFILDEDPFEAAKLLCDKHIPKMIVETAQMLCTAHRSLDGQPLYTDIVVKSWKSSNMIKLKKKRKINLLPRFNEYNFSGIYDDKIINGAMLKLYMAAHENHPCTIWARECSANYKWLFQHFVAMLLEYTYRYNKMHGSVIVYNMLKYTMPDNIKKSDKRTPFVLAMNNNPECIDINDPVKSYRDYYCTKNFDMKWTERKTPEWYKENK